jgi:hypothetical protein
MCCRSTFRIQCAIWINLKNKDREIGRDGLQERPKKDDIDDDQT